MLSGDGGGQEGGRPRAETVKVFGEALVCGVHLPHPGEDLVLCRAESRGKRYGVNRESFSVHCITESQYFCQAHNICSKLSCWDAVYNEWENASVIAKMEKDPTAILDDVTRRKEMLEIELQCSNYYLDMSDGVQHPVPKPDYTENAPESFLSSLLKKKED